MNSILAELGIESWKPILAALLLPPVPFLLLLLVAGLLLWARRGIGWLLMGLSIVGLWLCQCAGFGEILSTVALRPPAALSTAQIAGLKRDVQSRRNVAIVVLGGGREAFAPEYGVASLTPWSLERLRYGLWLARETGAPIAFSGGTGWGQTNDGLSEAQIAARIAASEFGRPLRWTEEESRDTRENAGRSVALMSRAGVTELVLVTHAWHMPRAMRAFAEAGAGRVKMIAAPMALAPRVDVPLLKWLPSSEGYLHVRAVLRECIGLLMGS
jgi:uncharacterized SAM-binding protein YcdF (DUF218 family)